MRHYAEPSVFSELCIWLFTGTLPKSSLPGVRGAQYPRIDFTAQEFLIPLCELYASLHVHLVSFLKQP